MTNSRSFHGFRRLLWLAAIALVPATALAGPVTPVALGTSTDAWDGFSGGAHRIAVDAERGLVVFVHRQDVTVWGGGAFERGRLRVDVSTNGGATFATDLGPLSDTDAGSTMLPNALIPRSSSEPWSLVWAAVGVNLGFVPEGLVAGEARGTADSAEVVRDTWTLRTQAGTQLALSSLCEGADGEYWGILSSRLAREVYTLTLAHGVTDSDTGVVWSVNQSITYSAGQAPSSEWVELLSPSIAFSPDGSVGWVAWLGAQRNDDLDSELHLMVSQSLDAGATWSSPVEIPVTTFGWTGDEDTLVEALEALGPGSSGRPTASGELDLTVDADGQAHILMNVANAVDDSARPWRPDTSVGHMMVHVMSAGTALSFSAREVAFLNSHTYGWGIEFGGDFPPNTYVQGNRPQIARNADGSAVFFAWSDSPFALVGEVGGENVQPSLFVSAMNPETGAVLPAVDVTSGDVVWSGLMLLWSMGPVVLEDSGVFRLPIVAGSMQVPNDLTQPTSWWWFGNDATIARADLALDEPGDDTGVSDAGGDTGVPDTGDDTGVSDAGDDTGVSDAGDDTGVSDAGSDVTDDADTGVTDDADAGVSDTADLDQDAATPDGGDDSGTPGDDAALADTAGDSTGPGDGGDAPPAGTGGCSATPAVGGLWFALAALVRRRSRRD